MQDNQENACHEKSELDAVRPGQVKVAPKRERVSKLVIVLVALGGTVFLIMSVAVVAVALHFASRPSAADQAKMANLAAHGIPARDSSATPNLIDLGAFYNFAFADSLQRNPNRNDAAALPQGRQSFGADFRLWVRGGTTLRAASGDPGRSGDFEVSSLNVEGEVIL